MAKSGPGQMMSSKFQPGTSKSPKRPKTALSSMGQTKSVGRRNPLKGPRKPRTATYGKSSKVSSKRQRGQRQPTNSTKPDTGISTSLKGLNF
jgi:hypothetical protein